jgi:hypothetical protein
MRNLLRKLFRRENAVALIVIAVAILSLTDLAKNLNIDKQGVTLALLAFLAIDALTERLGYLDRIENSLNKLGESFSFKPTAKLFLKTRVQKPPLEELLASAQEVWINARNLNTVIIPHYNLFERRLAEGCSFRIIMIDPDSLSAQLASEIGLNPTGYKDRMQMAITSLKQLAGQPTNTGRLELRLINFLPPFSLLIKDGKRSYGWMSVELYGYRVSARERPSFELTSSTDELWFKFYLKQFEDMWENAHEYHL